LRGECSAAVSAAFGRQARPGAPARSRLEEPGRASRREWAGDAGATASGCRGISWTLHWQVAEERHPRVILIPPCGRRTPAVLEALQMRGSFIVPPLLKARPSEAVK